MNDTCFRLIKKIKSLIEIFLAESLHFAELGSDLLQPYVKLGYVRAKAKLVIIKVGETQRSVGFNFMVPGRGLIFLQNP